MSLTKFLSQAYMGLVIGKPVNIEAEFDKYSSDPEFVKAARAELNRIRKIGSIPDLAQRDFSSYKSYQALDMALSHFDRKQNAAG